MKNWIFILLFFSAYCQAQDTRKYWSEGPLTWDDFQGLPPDQNRLGSEFNYILSYEFGTNKFRDTTLTKYMAVVYMLKDASWVNLEQQVPNQLRYYQVLFDILEVQRRKFQKDLDRAERLAELPSLFDSYFRTTKGRIDHFEKETNGGQNPGVLATWESKIQNELQALPIQIIPPFLVSNFGIGLHFDLPVFQGLTGPVSGYLSPALGFSVGFEFGWKKMVFIFNDALLFNRVKQDFLTKNNWEKGKILSGSLVELGLGYRCWDRPKYKITPYAGLGFNQFSYRADKNTQEEYSMDSYGPLIGLNVDFKLGKYINLAPNYFANGRQFYETSILTKFSIQKIDLSNQLKGFAFNLSVGYSGFIHFLKY